jgi:hypothetical protein
VEGELDGLVRVLFPPSLIRGTVEILRAKHMRGIPVRIHSQINPPGYVRRICICMSVSGLSPKLAKVANIAHTIMRGLPRITELDFIFFQVKNSVQSCGIFTIIGFVKFIKKATLKCKVTRVCVSQGELNGECVQGPAWTLAKRQTFGR